MFKIDKENNKISALNVRSFAELGFKERQHLQEWIAQEPSCLGEELLIIQKEFAGFSDTKERLDLLALDKNGSLVIIENKLDDTGKDVTWQALKYASYCSSLTTNQITKIFQDFLGKEENAEETLTEFLDEEDFDDITLNKGFSQRIFLIAANFRKEVTSTVLWLANFKVKVKCFKVTPYSMGENLFLNLEQIIPTKDAEDYTIGLADKAQDEISGISKESNRHTIRRQFWSKALEASNNKMPVFQNRSTTKDSWISAGSGVKDIVYTYAAIKTYARAEIYIRKESREETLKIFDQLFANKTELEKTFGGKLIWERETAKGSGCRIKTEQNGNIYDKDRWPDMIDFMVDAMARLEAAFRNPLKSMKNEI